MKEAFESLTKTKNEGAKKVTATVDLERKDTNKAITSLNKKILEILNNRCLIAYYLMKSLSELL